MFKTYVHNELVLAKPTCLKSQKSIWVTRWTAHDCWQNGQLFEANAKLDYDIKWRVFAIQVYMSPKLGSYGEDQKTATGWQDLPSHTE